MRRVGAARQIASLLLKGLTQQYPQLDFRSPQRKRFVMWGKSRLPQTVQLGIVEYVHCMERYVRGRPFLARDAEALDWACRNIDCTAMKHFIKLVVVGLLAFGMAYAIGSYVRRHREPPKPEIVKPEEAAELPEALVVYCFHGNKPTPRCKKIEESTHRLLKELFSKEMKEGKIVWRVVNYELPENARFVKRYNLTTTCIVLVDGRPGRWGDWKGFLPQTWDLVENDAMKYTEFMDAQIRESLR